MRQMLAEKLHSVKGPVADNWFFILLVVFIIGFFIIPDRSFHRNGYYLLLFLPAVILFLRNSSLRKITTETPFILVLVFLLYAALSLAWSEHRTWEELYDVTRYTLLILSFPLVISLAFRNQKWKVDDLLWWSMIGVSIVALITVIIFYSDSSFPYSRVEGLGRTVFVPTTSANLHGFFAITALSFLLQGNKRAQLSLPVQTITLISTFTLFLFMILSQTRGALLALILATFLLLILKRNWKAIFLLILITILTIVSIEFSDSIRGLFERGHGTRPYIWLESLWFIAEKPFFGHGVATETEFLVLLNGDTKTYGNSHNIILYILVHYGLLGLFLWSILTSYTIRQAIFIGKETKDWTLIILLAYCLAAMMFNSRAILASPNAFWISYWLPVGLVLFKDLLIAPQKLSK